MSPLDSPLSGRIGLAAGAGPKRERRRSITKDVCGTRGIRRGWVRERKVEEREFGTNLELGIESWNNSREKKGRLR